MDIPIIISDSHREDNCPVLPASLRAGLTVLVTGLCMVSPLAAQKLYLSPTIGAYIPTTELIKASQGEEFKQEIAVAVGGRKGLRFGERLGLVTSVSYVRAVSGSPSTTTRPKPTRVCCLDRPGPASRSSPGP